MFNTCKASGSSGEDEQMDLPPGFRFHPTDEELITHYLSPKVLDSNFCARAIGEVDLNKVEPWDLPWMAKMGEKEWYFFCVRDRKYPTGLRTNRATQAGYWKATGKDKEIFKVKTLVGMKKTLVFYKGRAPKGEKTNWVMHEYRLDGKNSMLNLPKTARNEWVICRIFKKSAGGKKIHISWLTKTSNYSNNSRYSNLPPLLDISNCEGQTTASLSETCRVTCFSSRVEDQKAQSNNIFDNLSPNHLASSSAKTSGFSTTSVIFPKPATPNSYISSQIMPFFETLHQMDSSLMQDQSILKLLVENNVPSTKENVKTEFSQDTGMSTDMSSSLSNHEVVLRPYDDHQYFPMNSAGPVDIGCLWDY